MFFIYRQKTVYDYCNVTQNNTVYFIKKSNSATGQYHFVRLIYFKT